MIYSTRRRSFSSEKNLFLSFKKQKDRVKWVYKKNLFEPSQLTAHTGAERYLTWILWFLFEWRNIRSSCRILRLRISYSNIHFASRSLLIYQNCVMYCVYVLKCMITNPSFYQQKIFNIYSVRMAEREDCNQYIAICRLNLKTTAFVENVQSWKNPVHFLVLHGSTKVLIKPKVSTATVAIMYNLGNWPKYLHKRKDMLTIKRK